MKKIILGVLALMLGFVSCTDQENVEIEYQSSLSITASHIFDGYTTVLGDEFNMSGTNYGDWSLNLHAYIYDDNGLLIKKEEEQYSTLANILDVDLNLHPGRYSVVAIAEFSGIVDGQKYKFWNISGEDILMDLEITESPTICNSPFETLGITTREFQIGNNAENIIIDIMPATGLLQTIIWDDDFSGAGTNGFSFYASYIDNLTIYAQDLKQVVKFNGGINPIYDYGDQAARYPIMSHSPKTQYEIDGPIQSLGFRALLPQENRDFYWELNCIPGAGQFLFANGEDFQMSDMTDNKPDIESGKQYVMDLILDQCYLYVDDYDPNVDMFERCEGYITEYNNKVIRNALSERYDRYVGMSRSAIETYLDKEAWYTTETASSYLGDGLISMITVRYTDTTMDDADRIMLTWAINTEKQLDDVTRVLAEIYTPWERGTTDNIKQFINSTTLDGATVGISWNYNNKCMYFDAIN